MTDEEALERVRRYVQSRAEKPLRGQNDIINGVHMGTEWEAELRLSDLSQVLRSYEGMRERLEQSEARYIRLLNDPVGLELALGALQSEAL